MPERQSKVAEIESMSFRPGSFTLMLGVIIALGLLVSLSGQGGELWCIFSFVTVLNRLLNMAGK
jgi:hypothetical protein